MFKKGFSLVMKNVLVIISNLKLMVIYSYYINVDTESKEKLLYLNNKRFKVLSNVIRSQH